MRRIKFRGIRLLSNDWEYGNLIQRPDGGHFIETGDLRLCPVQDFSIGQFTGLLDKDGKEIYEGDVIQDDYYNKHLIQYDEQEACFVACLLPITKFSSRGNVSQNWINEFDKVVIGNIHDNPELLEITVKK